MIFINLDICNEGCDWLEPYMMYVSPEGGSTGESYHHDMGVYYMIIGYLTACNFRDFFQNHEYSANYMHAKLSCFTVYIPS